MRNLYLYPINAPATIRVVELESAKDFKRKFEDVKKGQVVLAHGFCTVCEAVTYYVRDYNMDGLSHICSKCGIRFCFQHGDNRYIAMEDLGKSWVSERVIDEIRHFNSIPVQKALLEKALEEFLKEKEKTTVSLDKEIKELKLL